MRYFSIIIFPNTVPTGARPRPRHSILRADHAGHLRDIKEDRVLAQAALVLVVGLGCAVFRILLWIGGVAGLSFLYV